VNPGLKPWAESLCRFGTKAPLFPKMTGDETTLEFYGREAERYCERTGSAPTATLGAFLGRLPHGATILELGCGSGRDSAEMLQRGYNVLPTDGSPEMAASWATPPSIGSDSRIRRN
jgi:SAM-dependent methyltransferase